MARREGHHFGAHHGFTGSAGKTLVRPHLRSGGQPRPKHDDAAADTKLVKKLVKPAALKRP